MVAEVDERGNCLAGLLALTLKARSKRTDSIEWTCIKKFPIKVMDKEQFTRGKKKKPCVFAITTTGYRGNTEDVNVPLRNS